MEGTLEELHELLEPGRYRSDAVRTVYIIGLGPDANESVQYLPGTMTGSDVFGGSLGMLMGCLTGAVFLWLFKLVTIGKHPVATVFTIITKVFGLPSCWFTGPWLSARIFNTVDWALALPAYVLALSLTFVVIAAYPIREYARTFGRESG